jgi:hypothetical protein
VGEIFEMGGVERFEVSLQKLGLLMYTEEQQLALLDKDNKDFRY